MDWVHKEDFIDTSGGGGGGYVFFLKNYSDSHCCWKKYSDFGGGKKNNLIQSFWQKNKYSNSCVVGIFFSERNKKPYPTLPSS